MGYVRARNHFFRGFEGLTPKFLTTGVRPDDPWKSAGDRAGELLLWADFSVLISVFRYSKHSEVAVKQSQEHRSLPNDNKISDNKIRKNSKFYCHDISQEKHRFGQFSVKCPLPNPLQNANFINIVVSASLRTWKSPCVVRSSPSMIPRNHGATACKLQPLICKPANYK